MFYQPPRALGLLMGVVLAAWAFGIAIVLLTFGWGRPFDLVTAIAYIGAAISVGVGLMFSYWCYALATMWYALDRNGLVIHWGVLSQVVRLRPLTEQLCVSPQLGTATRQGRRVIALVVVDAELRGVETHFMQQRIHHATALGIAGTHGADRGGGHAQLTRMGPVVRHTEVADDVADLKDSLRQRVVSVARELLQQ